MFLQYSNRCCPNRLITMLEFGAIYPLILQFSRALYFGYQMLCTRIYGIYQSKWLKQLEFKESIWK